MQNNPFNYIFYKFSILEKSSFTQSAGHKSETVHFTEVFNLNVFKRWNKIINGVMDKAIKYLGIGITDKKRFFWLNPN